MNCPGTPPLQLDFKQPISSYWTNTDGKSGPHRIAVHDIGVPFTGVSKLRVPSWEQTGIEGRPRPSIDAAAAPFPRRGPTGLHRTRFQKRTKKKEKDAGSPGKATRPPPSSCKGP